MLLHSILIYSWSTNLIKKVKMWMRSFYGMETSVRGNWSQSLRIGFIHLPLRMTLTVRISLSSIKYLTWNSIGSFFTLKNIGQPLLRHIVLRKKKFIGHHILFWATSNTNSRWSWKIIHGSLVMGLNWFLVLSLVWPDFCWSNPSKTELWSFNKSAIFHL